MKITYWSDFTCPFCYIAEQRILKIIRRLGMENDVELELKSYELDADAPDTCTCRIAERIGLKYGMPLKEAEEQVEWVSSLGRKEGIDFRLAEARCTNTLNAHRLAKLALTRGGTALAARVIHGLFDAYFTRSLELASPAVLLSVGEEAGLERREIEALLTNDDYTADVRLDEQEASERGIVAVPYFIMGGNVIVNGAQPDDTFKKALTEARDAVLAPASVDGMTCGPNGCSLDHRR